MWSLDDGADFPPESVITAMSNAIEPVHIAARISFLIGADRAENIGTAATLLGVSERALRFAVDATAPLPSVEVIIAVVRHYGVDPFWLVFGDCEPAASGDALRATAALMDAEVARPPALVRLGD
jgi:hypothetical protein